MRQNNIIILLIVAAAFIYSACGGQKSTDTISMPAAKRQINKENQELNRKLIQESFSTTVSDDYLIGPGDLLDIQVLEAPDLNTEARVTSNNSISFPLLGKVDIGGLTSQEAEARITEMLTEGYMHDPHVVVAIKEYRSQRVAVIGSVKNPGTYELLGKGSILDALALAGGLTQEASDVAYVTRKNSTKEEKSIKVDLNDLLDEGDTSLNVPIRMGDVVYVPEAGVVYVDGAVQKPGTIPIEDDMTVSQAITAAGGLNRVAEDSDVRLMRNNNGKVEMMEIDLDQVQEGQMSDIVLEDQDVIVVGKNAIRNFFDTIRLGLFFPPFSVGVQ